MSSPIEADSGDLTNVGKGQDVENPEAEYYAEALKAQGDVEAYLIAYASAVADRKEFLSEERSLLATHEARVAKLRVTQAAKNAMEDIEIANIPDEVAEQAAQLMAERQAFRTARLNNDCKRPLKALLMELNSVIFGQHRPEEIAIAQTMVTMLKAYIPKQSDYVEKLNKELGVFRATFNRRVVYFAALQEISDSVSAPEFKDIKKEIAECSTEIDELELKLTRMVVKGRFLQFLGTREDGQEELKEDCIICMGSSDDTQAVLLECGHFFCIVSA